ncbi:MAG TPA: D-alanine--D-alanine ligase family protein [Pyrinomonadaceae bacterium]|jgi:D-alanine-D-alanine ligase|nr:D-alanine--D-alanine ligase family protein [Pyrinomonadaceae bacterium]
MSTKVRVGVIFGGRSGEHEISLRSARAVLVALDRERYEIIPIGIDQTGRWLSSAETLALLPPAQAHEFSEQARGDRESVALIGDPSQPGLTIFNGGEAKVKSLPLDVVFPILHGTFGEDGTIQGLFELAKIPYIGCGVLASSCGMDKVTMKALFREAGLPICRHTWLARSEWERDAEAALIRVEAELGYPCFVKPANLGSSVGISRAANRDELRSSIELAARYDRRIMIEEAVNAREIECAILGNDEPQASLPGEYVLRDERAAFLDYTEKYADTGRVEFVVPAPLTKEQTARIRELAVKTFRVIDGAGLARVDFFLTRETNQLYVNEVNTMPGLTDVSGYPKMWAGTGKPFSAVLDELIELAFARAKDKSRNLTSRV